MIYLSPAPYQQRRKRRQSAITVRDLGLGFAACDSAQWRHNDYRGLLRGASASRTFSMSRAH